MPRSTIIFDLDGTLTKPCLDFDRIRAEIGCTGPILEAMARMSPAEQARADAIVLKHERVAADNAELFDDAVEIVARIRRSGRPVAILTRNSRATVETVLRKFGIEVDALRTREDGAIKPSPAPVLSICEELRADPRESWMVGDYLFDIHSGRAAGTRTVLMIGDGERPDYADQADHVIRRLAELIPLLSGNTPETWPRMSP